jgi:hypothetical protein
MDTLPELLDLSNPLTWVLASVLLAAVATNAAWLLQRRRPDALPSEVQVRSTLAWLTKALFYGLPPVIAWQTGILSPFYMGVSEPEWLTIAALGAPLAAVITGVLLLGWIVYRHAELVPGQPASAAARIFATLAAPLDALLQQWHWAFYRALIVGWLAVSTASGTLMTALAAESLYWGSWLGMALVVLEFGLNPFARARLRTPGLQEAALRTVALAVATTALFTLTRSFWLCLACHLIVETVITGWLPLRTAPEQT